MSTLILTGNLTKVGKSEFFDTKKGQMEKRKALLKTNDGEYSQDIPLEFVGKKADLAKKFKGKDVEVHINLRSFEYEGKILLGAPQVWKIDDLEEEEEAPAPKPKKSSKTAKPADDNGFADDDDDDDLPF